MIYPVTAKGLQKELDPEVSELTLALMNGITTEKSKCLDYNQKDFHIFD